ncbi:hypothetical protein H257_08921 [Aphanomyces astaci]|uniref:Uncharacterized protein n=1 Tax=Aphanomyces astaci TaxID=112090 RepID=W4GD55_APHAT|nr:hypothetical protein H257_08921 [Aphanomyces astaci]ETV77004.1 hypothetical protein H257_08921 [Aphanomyces astaci]|eukprot:XP_009833310.1 hypothetical protein H257_08921 [Aphanomyces astaci]
MCDVGVAASTHDDAALGTSHLVAPFEPRKPFPALVALGRPQRRGITVVVGKQQRGALVEPHLVHVPPEVAKRGLNAFDRFRGRGSRQQPPHDPRHVVSTIFR